MGKVVEISQKGFNFIEAKIEVLRTDLIGLNQYSVDDPHVSIASYQLCQLEDLYTRLKVVEIDPSKNKVQIGHTIKAKINDQLVEKVVDAYPYKPNVCPSLIDLILGKNKGDVILNKKIKIEIVDFY